MSSQQIRKLRVTKKLSYLFPVVTISRSNKNIMAQVIDPDTRLVLFTTHSNKISSKTKTEKSVEVGKAVGEWLKSKDMPKVVFNRNGFVYHGRIKAVADAIRESGIEI